MQERLETPRVSLDAVCTCLCDIVRDVIQVLSCSDALGARQLSDLLASAHLQALFRCHDEVVKTSRHKSPVSIMPSDETAQPQRIVGLIRKPDEPLVNNHK